MGWFRRKPSAESSPSVTPETVAALAARLPDPQTLMKWSRSMAMLDAILCPEWDMRYFSFNAQWAPDEQMASMRNGSGDEYSFTFTPKGTYGRGFDHESALSPFIRQPPRPHEGLLDVVPDALHEAVQESAFTLGDVPAVTLTVWRLDSDATWSHGWASPEDTGVTDDGGSWLFDQLDGDPRTYQAFASDYFEVSTDLGAITHLFRHLPLSDQLVRSLNPEVTLSELSEDIDTIGYPAGGS